MSTPSVNVARSSVSQRVTPRGTDDSARGAGSPSAHRPVHQPGHVVGAGRHGVQARARRPARRGGRPRTSSAASSARTAAGAIRPSTGAARSTQRSSMPRPETSMPRKTSLSDIDRPIRWRCSPSRNPSQPSAPGDVGHPAQRVVVERLGPHVHRVGPGGHPQVQPAALQLAQLRGDLADQHLALGVAAEAPRLRGQPVPGHDLAAGAGQVAVDGAQRDRPAIVPPAPVAASPATGTGPPAPRPSVAFRAAAGAVAAGRSRAAASRAPWRLRRLGRLAPSPASPAPWPPARGPLRARSRDGSGVGGTGADAHGAAVVWPPDVTADGAVRTAPPSRDGVAAVERTRTCAARTAPPAAGGAPAARTPRDQNSGHDLAQRALVVDALAEEPGDERP